MEVTLKVLVGPNVGRELPVAGPKFLVGRAEDCALRPRSELISRHHCVLLIEEGLVTVRDFGSKNGTLVNDKRVRGEIELKNGDKLTIGPLEFEVCLRVAVASKKRPKVDSIKEAASRTAEASVSADELEDVGEWIKEGEEAPAKADTRRLKFNETEEIDLKNSETQVGPLQIPQVPAPHTKPDKKQPGKLPQTPSSASKDSGQAASDVLNKFFKRR